MPIEPRLIRSVASGGLGGVLWREAEGINEPGVSIVRALELNFVAAARHHCEQPVPVRDAKWLQRRNRRGPTRPWLDHPHHLRERRIENPRQHHGSHGELQREELRPECLSPFVFESGRGKRFRFFSGEVTLFQESGEVRQQELVIEQQKPESQYQVIQERVVRRKYDADLPRRDNQKAQNSQSPRQKHHPREPQFQRQRSKSPRCMNPVWPALHVPADPSWQRPILVILVKRREGSPLRVAAHNFRNARFKVDPEALPHQQEQTRARWLTYFTPTRPNPCPREK